MALEELKPSWEDRIFLLHDPTGQQRQMYKGHTPCTHITEHWICVVQGLMSVVWMVPVLIHRFGIDSECEPKWATHDCAVKTSMLVNHSQDQKASFGTTKRDKNTRKMQHDRKHEDLSCIRVGWSY